VILATAVLEKLKSNDDAHVIDMVVRKGNEGLVKDHPAVSDLIVWDKKEGKYKTLMKVVKTIRQRKYDVVINLQRFGSTGMMTAFSKAKIKIGFDKNPFSAFFDQKIKHEMNGIHEVERNLALLTPLGISGSQKPKLYPSTAMRERLRDYRKTAYVVMAPSSVWFTKQWSSEKWVELIQEIKDKQVYLIGAPDDRNYCEAILQASEATYVTNLAGELSLLESAALMEKAAMNYVNDSAPMHLASSVNAPVTAIFCSTIPKFGFGPLSEVSRVVETEMALDCRPCGLHGKKTCPEGHFNCSKSINVKKVLSS